MVFEGDHVRGRRDSPARYSLPCSVNGASRAAGERRGTSVACGAASRDERTPGAWHAPRTTRLSCKAKPPLAPHSGPSRRQIGYTRRQPEESVLYGVVRDEIETFLARARERDRPAPRFVERELAPISSAGSSPTASCGCTAMPAAVTAWWPSRARAGASVPPAVGGAWPTPPLVDRVFPEAPVRQWVLSLPFALRYRLAYDARLAGDVLHLFVRAIFASLRRRARQMGHPSWAVRRRHLRAAFRGRPQPECPLSLAGHRWRLHRDDKAPSASTPCLRRPTPRSNA